MLGSEIGQQVLPRAPSRLPGLADSSPHANIITISVGPLE
jgi:hypothetical protein